MLVLCSDANGLALALYIILSSDELDFVFTHHGQRQQQISGACFFFFLVSFFFTTNI